MRLAGKVAVITGGGSGIGLVSVRKFAAEGANVLVADCNTQSGNAAVEAALQEGYDVSFIETDVAREEHVEAMCEHSLESYGRLDILFHNAGGGGAIGPLTETTAEDWNHTFDVLAKGVFLGIKHGATVMRRQGKGGAIAQGSGRSLKFQKKSARNSRYSGITKGSTGAENKLRKLDTNETHNNQTDGAM